MKIYWLSVGLLLASSTSQAQSPSTADTGAVMDTAVFGRIRRAREAERQLFAVGRPCPVVSDWLIPTCIDGHRDQLFPIQYGLLVEPKNKVVRRATRHHAKPTVDFFLACMSWYYCTRHQKHLFFST